MYIPLSKTRGPDLLRLLLLLVVLACQAPHHNPLDPQNPDYAFTRIAGTIRTASYPHTPIQGAVLCWQPGPALTSSRADGTFLLDRTASGSGRLVCTHPDYFPDSLELSLTPGQTGEAGFLLNRKPAMDDLYIYSIVLNRYPALRTSQIGVTCKISDQDGDIGSVWLENEALALQSPLVFDPGTQTFQKIYSPADLHLASIQEAASHDFRIRVADKAGHELALGSASVRRIITDEIPFVEPANAQIVAARPVLQWKKFAPGFSFTWLVEVYSAELIPLKVWQKSGLATKSTFIEVDQPLEPGDYYWVVWCVDEYRNCARSKPASFTVQ
jgi:hypothetical protein